jgi:hypothetical protein
MEVERGIFPESLHMGHLSILTRSNPSQKENMVTKQLLRTIGVEIKRLDLANQTPNRLLNVIKPG